jgi:adenylosuccinate lyase
MIPRYSRPEMTRLWSVEHRLGLWLEVELAAAEAMAELGAVPADAVARLEERARAERARIVDPERIAAIEATTRHDVIAFLTHVEEVCGPDARFLHQGMTSSDLLDTTLAIQLTQAADQLIADMEGLLEALAARAREHAHTVCIGRSHGIHAEPTTFGLKLAGHHAELRRGLRRLRTARGEIATCKISGAVGTYAHLDPLVEHLVAARFGLRPEPVSTQVIPRDRHAAFFTALAVIASGIERLATEIRHLQRTEVGEVEEAFAAGQKGSSAMPHKRNPVLSENLTGLARLVRSHVVPALENVVLWHERDISHSSVERVIAPDATIALDFALDRATGLIERLVVRPERMRANLEATHGLVFSQAVLLALTGAGMGRQEAYEVVQRRAMQAWEERRPLQGLLEADETVARRLDRATLAGLFDLGRHTRHVDAILARALDDPAGDA